MIYQINNTLVETNYMIGKIIIESEQNGNIRAEYGKDILKKLSKKLTNEFGSGFSLSGLYNMRLFYIRYKNFQPLVGNLSWSHYCYLIYIDDIDESNKKEVIVRNFKCGDKVIWHNNGLSFHAEILKTFKTTCIIRYDDGITYQEEEVPYYSILNREVLEDD